MLEARDENSGFDHPEPALEKPDDNGRSLTRYRTIFISDIHLGSAGFRFAINEESGHRQNFL